MIDPHKHGLQPYGCGCVLFRDPAVGRFYKHDSPYTYFTSKELHLGEISLECSRAGAAAVALWATQQLLPLTPGGEFARGLAQRPPRRARAGPPRCAPTRASSRSPPARRNSTLWSGSRHAADPRARPPRGRSRSSTPAPRAICTWLLYNCRNPGLAAGATARKRDGGHLPALGADEARARSLARPDLGAAERGSRVDRIRNRAESKWPRRKKTFSFRQEIERPQFPGCIGLSHPMRSRTGSADQSANLAK